LEAKIMPNKFDTRKKDVLLSDERLEALRPEELLRDLGLGAGQTVADIGCGPGFFTLPAARIVGEQGHVFAADVQGEMLTAVRARAAEAGLANIRVVKTSDTEIPMPAASCDFVLLFFVLHEIDQRAHFLHRAARLLKPEGRLAVMEWRRSEQMEGPPQADRIDPEELEADAQAAGLHVAEQREVNDRQYLALLEPVKHQYQSTRRPGL
jgi:ubiquinone/menaquinone biosynthesis C-methylase UbiE